MRLKKISYLLFVCCLSIIYLTNTAGAAAQMVEVSVDIIEINQTDHDVRGLTWKDAINFEESMMDPSAFNFLNPAPGRGIASSVISVGNIERVDPIGATLRTLISKNAGRILANPKLATESGAQASFVVGGEIPVPVVSPQGVSIEWKSYGINLQVNPTILTSGNQISAQIQVAISDLDYANSVKLEGYDVPALLNRSANSKVTVDDGGTAVIAGLKQTKRQLTEQGVPLLSNIPVVNWFFKGTDDSNIETSMIIFVTFNIIQPEKQ